MILNIYTNTSFYQKAGFIVNNIFKDNNNA